MNNTAPGAVASSRTHPAIIVAAIALTVLALVGVAALTGYLPIAKSFTSPMNVASPAQSQGTVPGDSLSSQYGGGSTDTVAESPEPAKAEPAKPEPVKVEEPAVAPQPPQATAAPAPKPAPKPAPPKTVVAKAQPAPPASYSQPGPSTPNYSETNARAAVATSTPASPPPPAP